MRIVSTRRVVLRSSILRIRVAPPLGDELAIVSQASAESATAPKRAEVRSSAPTRVEAAPAKTPQNGDRLLDALKEELFQLEMERHQGKISGEDYEKAKSALDTTLARAAKRAGG